MLRAGLAPLIAATLATHQGQSPQVLLAALRSLDSVCYVGGGLHTRAVVACLDANLLPLIKASMDVFRVSQQLSAPSQSQHAK